MRHKNGIRPNPVIEVSLPEATSLRVVSDLITSMTLNLDDNTFAIAVLDKKNSVITGRYAALYRGLLVFVQDSRDHTTQLDMLLDSERGNLQKYIRLILEDLINDQVIMVEE